MIRSIGLFDSFDNLDQIPPEALAYWLKLVPKLTSLENYLANRILYPQALSLTELDMKIDLAILREALKLTKAPTALVNDPKKGGLLGDNPFLNTVLRKLLIPVRFVNFVPDLPSLAWAFIDALLLDRRKQDFFQDLWTLVLTDDTDEIAGSILLPQFDSSSGVMNLKLLGKDYTIRPGSLTVIPCPKDRCEIAYRLQHGRCLGREENAVEVYGGKLGLVVDGRRL